MNPVVNIYRLKRSSQGTLGMLVAPGFTCYTLELPWHNNQRNISCIPAGTYDVEIRKSPRYGNVYHVKEVPDRSYILIHSGNWAGDKSKGYRTNVAGCILLGQKRGILAGQLAVLNSRITINRFMREMENEPFKLNIIENFIGGFE